MYPCHQNCTLRDIQKAIMNQLYNLNQVREDLEDLLHHEPARSQEVTEKTRILNDKIREKLARTRQLNYCIENGCDVCYPDGGVYFE